MKFNLMQIVRLVLMVLAIAGIIYAVEYVPLSLIHISEPTRP